MRVAVVIETRAGEVAKPSLEALTLSRSLGDPAAVLLGEEPSAEAAAQLAEYGAQEVVWCGLSADDAARLAPEARWFVDRSPHLAAHADVLRALFPEAAIIRLERAPLQQGLDIHRRCWTDGDPMVNDLAAIGRELRAARRAFARLERRCDLQITTLDADFLATSPVEADAELRAAAGLPVSLSTFSSPGVRLATADLARFPAALFTEHGGMIAPLKRALREYGR